MHPDRNELDVPAVEESRDFDGPTLHDGEAVVGDGGLSSGRFGEYEILGKLGEGGMGVVYRARQPRANRVVALKVIHSQKAASGPPEQRDKLRERFRNEAQAAARLEHENIVPVYDVGEAGELLYFSMRLVDGKSLKELVQTGPLEGRRAAQLLLDAAHGIEEAHRHGVLHRDLKPHNILVDARNGRAMVADFGLAKLTESSAELTRDGEAIGTPSYMSPEQIRDAAGVDARTDVYALGATLYQLLTGRPPFQAANTLGTMRQVLYDEPVAPRKLNSAIDRDLDTICLKCLEKDPARRYAGAEELAADLGRFLRGEPIRARPIGRVERAWRWRRRNPLAATLLAATATLAIVAATAIIVGYRETRSALAESQQHLALARQAVDELYTEVSEIDLQDQPGMQPLKRKLLSRALDYYQRLLAAQRGDADLSTDLAENHFRAATIIEEIGSIEEAERHFQNAARIQRTLLAAGDGDAGLEEALSDSLNAMGRVAHRLRRPQEALQAYEEARQIRTELAARFPENREYARKLANVVMNIGLHHARHGDADRAAKQYRLAQESRRKLLEAGADGAVTRDFARGAFNEGTLYTSVENFAAAAVSLQTAVDAFQKLHASQPESLSLRSELATSSVLLADALRFLDRPEDAERAHAAGLEILEQLAEENPEVIGYQEQLAATHVSAGQWDLQRALTAPASESGGLTDEGLRLLSRAADSFQASREILSTALQREPQRVSLRLHLAVSQQTLGEIALLQGDAAGARGHWEAGLQALAAVQQDLERLPDCAAQWELLNASLQSLTAAPSPPAVD